MFRWAQTLKADWPCPQKYLHKPPNYRYTDQWQQSVNMKTWFSAFDFELCPTIPAYTLRSKSLTWNIYTCSQQTWSGFSPTTVPDNNRQSGFSPTTVPKLSTGLIRFQCSSILCTCVVYIHVHANSEWLTIISLDSLTPKLKKEPCG